MAAGILVKGDRRKHHQALNKPRRDLQLAAKTLPGSTHPLKGQGEEVLWKAWNKPLTGVDGTEMTCMKQEGIPAMKDGEESPRVRSRPGTKRSGRKRVEQEKSEEKKNV